VQVVLPAASATAPTLPAAAPAGAQADRRPARVVPKGLRSFDAADADFFLDLLPGPRDREGLPDSLRFWKGRVEETDADRTFAVGLLYGPSGCGKSSLVKAGLLPRLAGHVLPVYVEATAEETEARVLKGLHKHCPELPARAGLGEALAALRRGRGLPAGKKVLLVLDQFEQCLHARGGAGNAELVQALRQCDGGRVQCLVLVRDDFGMAATRFMRDLEVRIVEGHNFATVDLFDPGHARQVLAAFGRAFGRLPDNPAAVAPDQERFLEQAVAGLAQDGKVVSVRLALFAEMVKGKSWAPATLRDVGGAEGVGVAFLEESLGSRAANPEHRLHSRAAQAVLKGLLPEQGSDIKGSMRPERALGEASGYAGRPGEFAELLRILDAELRLVTPTSPEGQEAPTQAQSASAGTSLPLAGASGLCGGECYYQLTHDYLVPSLRDWLTRQQRETRRGRAELRLAERAALWTAKPESRHLPAWWEWLTIRLLTRTKDWTPPQRRMMHRAACVHTTRGAVLAVLLGAALLTGLTVWGQVSEQRRQDRAAALVRALKAAETADVPKLVEEVGPYRRWANPLLRQTIAEAVDGSKEHLHAALALLPADGGQADYLAERLLAGRPDEVLVLRDALRGHGRDLAERYWAVVQDNKADPGRRLRAACALAAYDPDGGRWADVSGDVVNALVRENLLLVPRWAEALRPVRDRLIAPLADVFRSAGRSESERDLATTLLTDYAADRPEVLAHLLPDADPKAYAALFPLLQRHRERAVGLLTAELDGTAPWDWKDAPLDPAWAAPEPALVRQAEAAQGLVAERFAFCQTLPLEQFEAVAAGLRRGGYRPVRLRPYAVGEAVQVAAAWTRDGRDGREAHGLTAAEVRQQDAERHKQGYQPVDLAGYLDGGRERYAALWVKAGQDDEARLYVGVPEPRHKADGLGPLLEAKYRSVTLQGFLGGDGKARYSGVMWKGTPDGTATWNDDEGTHADRGLSDGLPMDVSLYPSRQYVADARAELLGFLSGSPWAGLGLRSQYPRLPHPERHYAGCFLKSAAFDDAVAFGLTPEEQLRRCRGLAGQDYRPAALSVAVFPWPQASRLQADQPASGPLAATVWHRPVVHDEAKEHLAKRQASVAVARLRLGQAERVWPLLQHHSDPRLRSYLIHRLSPLGADARALVKRLDEEPDVSAKRALLLCLGEFGPEQLPAAEREALVPALLKVYRDDPDPGLHGAAEWLLRRWQQADKLREIDKALATGKVEGQRRWYVNGQGQTLALIEGGEFLMGSPRTEEGRESGAEGTVEMQHRRRIGRTFALATKAVTVEEFLRFRKDYAYNKQYSPTPQHPVNAVSWYDAAAYCNWLSKQEGIAEDQWCYLPTEDGQFGPGMRLRPNYLRVTGYRLPTEAEWEFGCRAGAVTGRYYGETEELLGKYAWYTKHSQDKGMLVPGSLKPNDLGLFDVLGNAWQWYEDPIFLYPHGMHGDPARTKSIQWILKTLKVFRTV
jgi:formylglycine-generating enzyme required for sulfatase activity